MSIHQLLLAGEVAIRIIQIVRLLMQMLAQKEL